MKLNKIFLSMAALAFLGAMTAGCSGDDLTAETPQFPDTAGGTLVTKVTVSLDEHASTRMLDPSGMMTFEEGDKIAVIYKNTAGETVKAESAALNSFDILSSNSAKFSVTLTNPQASTPVRYIYPAAMAVAPIATDAAIDAATSSRWPPTSLNIRIYRTWRSWQKNTSSVILTTWYALWIWTVF